MTDYTFCHSFPRRWKNRPEMIKKGLEILENMVESGLLLTPEKLQWQEELVNGLLSEPIKIMQKRVCFAALKPTEITNHIKEFGPFTLEFNPENLISMGGMPVMYIPQYFKNGLAGVGSSLVVRLGEIQKILERLKKIDLLCKSNRVEERINITQNDVTVAQTRCTIGAARDILNFLGYDLQPFPDLDAMMRAFTGFLYPTSHKEKGILNQYRLGEWRIVANMCANNIQITKPLSKAARETLISIDRKFFTEELQFPKGVYQRIDQCQMLHKINNKHFLEFVSKVKVPKEALDNAKQILKKLKNAPEIVAINNY